MPRLPSILILAVLARVLAAAEPAPAPLCDLDAASAIFAAGPLGAFPPGWHDDSAWSQAVVAYGQDEEEGQRFWRIAVAAAQPGKEAQWCAPLPQLAPGRYRLHLRARALGGEQIGFGLRRQGAPFSYIWQRKQVIPYRWTDYDWTFALAEAPPPAGVWFMASAPGEVDIARLRLEALPPATGGTPPLAGGLLRDHRLPLGLPAGWNLSHEVSVGPDADEDAIDADTGEDGVPCLRLTARRRTGLYMEPFALPDPDRRWHAELAVRGSGHARVAVRADSREVYGRAIATGSAWTRIEVPVPAEPGVTAYRLFISLDAGEWVSIDRLRVADAAAAAPAPGPTPTVALACGDGDAAAAEVQFADEPAVLRWSVAEARDGDVLHLSVEDVEGGRRELAPVALAAQPVQSGSATYAAVGAPFGPYRCVAQVVGRDGAASPPAERVLYRLPRPRAWGRDAPGSPFGVHTDATRQLLTMAKAVGINWVRLHDAGQDAIGWYFLEPEPGVWRFADQAIARYRAAHLSILAPLSTAPPWASVCPAAGFADNPYSAKFCLPRSLDEFAAYVRTVVTRYRGQIAAWGVWNEPWMDCYLGAGYRADLAKGGRTAFVRADDPARAYTDLARIVHDQVRELDPRVPVVAAESTSGTGGPGMFDGEDWSRRLVAAGVLAEADVASFHTYLSGPMGGTDDRVARATAHAVGPLLAARPGMPVWLTEGASTINVIGSGVYRIAVPSDPEDIWVTGDRTCRFVIRLLACGVSKCFLFSMHCWNDIPGTRVFRSIVGVDGRLHPSGAAHAIMAWYLEGTTHRRSVRFADGTPGELFGDDDGSVLVALPGDGPPAWFPAALPAGVSACDLFGNPVARDGYRRGTLVWFSSSLTPAALSAALSAAPASPGPGR